MRRRFGSEKFVGMVMAFCMCLALAGCGATKDSVMMESMSTSGKPQMEEAKTEIFYDKEIYNESFSVGEVTDGGVAGVNAGMKADGESQAALQERKLIKTVDMNVETKEFDATMAAVEAKVSELGGYIENMETYNGSSYSAYRSSRNASMTARIPKHHLDTFLETVAGISNVVRRSESVEDVTLTYVDLESHKKVLQAEQETLIELMKKAKEIEDIITIESRLSEVRYQIESMESQLRTFDNKVDYSTVYLNINEVKELTPVEEETVLQRIGNGFKNSLKEIRDGMTDFAVWFVVNIPYFILWIAILVGILLLGKILVKVLRKKNEKSSEEK